MGQDWWAQHAERQKQNNRDISMKLKSIEANIEQLLTRVLAADNERLVKTYETKIGELEEEKVRLKEMLGSNRATPGAFADSFRTAPVARPIRLLGDIQRGKYEVVGPPGLEPGTKGL